MSPNTIPKPHEENRCHWFRVCEASRNQGKPCVIRVLVLLLGKRNTSSQFLLRHKSLRFEVEATVLSGKDQSGWGSCACHVYSTVARDGQGQSVQIGFRSSACR